MTTRYYPRNPRNGGRGRYYFKSIGTSKRQNGRNPPVATEDIVVNHRLDRQRETGNRPRAVIVVFSKITVRNDVIRARRRFYNTTDQHQIFVNEDLTQRRAALAAATRQLKRNKTIADCWTYNGKIVIKSLANAIKIISMQAELNTFQ